MCVCLGMFQRGRLLEWELKLVLLNVGIINILGLLFQVELEWVFLLLWAQNNDLLFFKSNILIAY